jgi:hypothetical protein
MIEGNNFRKQFAKKASLILKKNIIDSKNNFLIKDVSINSGLSIRDSEEGLYYLIVKYKGNVLVDKNGFLLFDFPNGFNQSIKTSNSFILFFNNLKKFIKLIVKLACQSWISLVIIFYITLFSCFIFIFSVLKKNKNNNKKLGRFHLFHSAYQLTAHSICSIFDLFYSGYKKKKINQKYEFFLNKRKKKKLLYFQVNKFFFESIEKKSLKDLNKKKIFFAIRINNGCINIFDLIKITNLSKSRLNRIIYKLIIDYDGKIKINKCKKIYYEFSCIIMNNKNKKNINYKLKELYIWEIKKKSLSITRNRKNINILIILLNFLNLTISFILINKNFTYEKMKWLINTYNYNNKYGFMLPEIKSSISIFFGLIPFVMSIILFCLPFIKLIKINSKKFFISHNNGKRGIVKSLHENLTKKGISEDLLISYFKKAAKRDPYKGEINNIVMKIGADMNFNKKSKKLIYKFNEF